MDIHELTIYLNLARTLHFGRTSRACNITPSALTRMIQRLEEQVGTALFIRDSRSVSLTPAGQAFQAYAQSVCRRWQQFQDELSTPGRLTGELSIFGSVTAVYGILPGILTRFRTRHPGVRIHLVTGDAARALPMVMDGDVDAAVAALPGKPPREMALLELTQTPLVFIAPTTPADTVIYDGPGIDWSRTPLIMPDRGISRDCLEAWLSRENISPNVYAQVAGNEAIIAMVSLGCGVGVVPRLVLDESPLRRDVRILSHAPSLAPFTIGLGTLENKRHTPKIHALWQIAADISYPPKD